MEIEDFVDRLEKEAAQYIRGEIKGSGAHWLESHARARLLSEKWEECRCRLDKLEARKVLGLDEIEYVIKKREQLQALQFVLDYINESPPVLCPGTDAGQNLDCKGWAEKLAAGADLNCLPHIKRIVASIGGVK
jgi:hypothetical protein